MKRYVKLALVVIYACALALCASGCVQSGTTAPAAATIGPDSAAERAVAKADMGDINSQPLVDSTSVYADDDPGSVVVFYLTVQKGSEADNTNHTFEEVNSVLRLQGMELVDALKCEVIVQEGDEHGPLPGKLGYGATQSNGTICLRGRTSTGAPQKSYRIDLLDSAGLWRGQKAIALNKHAYDNTRFRNKLFFDLLKEIPDLASLRTQFVHVYVKDETTDVPQTEFADFGLFTQVEIPNRRYLRNHGLSMEGNLYKANMCELFRYEDTIKLATDPTYDEAAFGEILESKNGSDHSKLIAMLDAVNDYSIPIEEVFEKHFNADNYFSYIAYNILMCNPDSNAQNYLLYSPANSDVWYYLLWDGDGSMGSAEKIMLGDSLEAEWTCGISNYWGIVLYNRVMKVERYREALYDKIEELHEIVTREKINEMIAVYEPVVSKYIMAYPDAVNLRCTFEQRDEIARSLADEVNTGYQNYIESIKKPMPFYMTDVEISANVLKLQWAESYDFDAEMIEYDVQVCRDWTFAPDQIVYESLGQLMLSAEMPAPEPGEYVWRVIARNESGQTQMAFDQFESAAGYHFGMRHFEVTAEGEVNNLL